MKDLLTIAELDSDYISSLITDAVKLKNDGWTNMLEHRMLALIFEKPSLRTRVSFEAAMRQLGGQSIYLSPAEVGLGKRESIPDVARVLSRYVSIICAHSTKKETYQKQKFKLAYYCVRVKEYLASCFVINTSRCLLK